jgi:cytidylate kinase
MTNKHHLERLSGVLGPLGNVTHHEEAQRPPAFTIAVGREAGVPDAEIAHEVGRRLGWPVYDRELLERIATEMHLRPGVLHRVDEKPISWLAERMQTFAAQPAVTEPAYVEHLIATLRSLAENGRCVVVGRGSVHVLPSRTTLRVRLMAPLWDRIACLVRQESLSHPEAGRRVARLDRERNEFIRKHFHKDAADVSHYDLVLNCSRFGVPECAEQIIEALHHLEARARVPVAAGMA